MSDNGSEDWMEEQQEPEHMVINPTSVRERIDDKLAILADFKNRQKQDTSRADIMAELSRDLCEYYGYIPDLASLFLELFSPAECVEFMDASDRPRPLVIRTNTLKITRKDLMDALGKRGVNLEAIEWSKVAIKVIESTVPIGATPEYLAGYYMLQAASSLCPVVALDPQPGEKILDMSAAPGGKTTYISQLMKNSGSVIANDLKAQRQKATVANMHRMGVKNAIVCCYDGRKIPQNFKGFDRVLLDAPCSGLGVIARDQTVKLQRTLKDIQRIAHLQKELLCAAVDAVDPKSSKGGIIVYSTCSVSVEENEQVIQYILQKRHVRLIDTGLDVGRPGYTRHKERRFHPSLSLTRRFYPHVHNMDGFYVAKLQKYENGPRAAEDVKPSESDEEEDEEEENSEEEEEEEEEEEQPPVKSAVAANKKATAPAAAVAKVAVSAPKAAAPSPPAAKVTIPAKQTSKKVVEPVVTETNSSRAKVSKASAKKRALPEPEIEEEAPVEVAPNQQKKKAKVDAEVVEATEAARPVVVLPRKKMSITSLRKAFQEAKKK